MIFAPKPVGNLRLDPESLKEDKKNCQKIGPCGVGQKALYLNSFFVDRTYYVLWQDVRRCFKRVAMSKGGYTGKGIFGSMPYLVVQLSNGLERQCNFKYEEDVDRLLSVVEKEHPEIPTHSKEAEKRLARAAAQEEARYLKHLSGTAAAAVEELRQAQAYLDAKPEVGDALSRAARAKRSVDGIRRSNFVAALVIFLLGIAGIVVGLVSLARGNTSWAIYCILFGVAAVFFTGAAGILPTARKNRASVQRDWDAALQQAQEYIDAYGNAGIVKITGAQGGSLAEAGQDGDEIGDANCDENCGAAGSVTGAGEHGAGGNVTGAGGHGAGGNVTGAGEHDAAGKSGIKDSIESSVTHFPVPAQYAHRIVLERMIRIIREGRTDNIPEAFVMMKEELRSLDHTKTVSQKEYDEIVTVKPMFRVMEYR